MKKWSKLAKACIVSAVIFCISPVLTWFVVDGENDLLGMTALLVQGVFFLLSIILAIALGIRDRKEPRSINSIIARLTLVLVCIIFFVGSCIAIPARLSYRFNEKAGECDNYLRVIEHAKGVWAIKNNKTAGESVDEADIAVFIIGGMPRCPKGGKYTINPIGTASTCSYQHSLLPPTSKPSEKAEE